MHASPKLTVTVKLEQAPRNGLLSAASRNSDDRNKHPAASALPPPVGPPPFFHRKRKWISSTRGAPLVPAPLLACSLLPAAAPRNICPRPAWGTVVVGRLTAPIITRVHRHERIEFQPFRDARSRPRINIVAIADKSSWARD